MIKEHFFKACFALLAFPVAAATIGSSDGSNLRFAHPVAMSADSAGELIVLEDDGQVLRINPDSGEQVGGFDSGLSSPRDVAIDERHRVIIADSDIHGVAVFEMDGSPVRTVVLPGRPMIQRVESLDNERLIVLLHDGLGSRIEQFDQDFRNVGTIDVTAPCESNPLASVLLDMAPDQGGNVWVVELTGCGARYRLRQYGSGGELLNAVDHQGQFDAKELESLEGLTVNIVSSMFSDDKNLYVVLGAEAKDGGIEVDVWNFDGRFLGRNVLREGFSDPTVRGIARGGKLVMMDMVDDRRIRAIPVSAMRKAAGANHASE